MVSKAEIMFVMFTDLTLDSVSQRRINGDQGIGGDYVA